MVQRPIQRFGLSGPQPILPASSLSSTDHPLPVTPNPTGSVLAGREGALKANVDSRSTVCEIKQAVKPTAQSGRDGKALIVPDAQ